MLPLRIESVQVRSFRNLDAVDVELGPRFNVIAGDNGQGKTNLLEAVYVLATSKSFRCSKMTDVVAFAGDLASVRGRIEEDGDRRVQSVGIRAGARLVRIDDKRPPTLAAYAVKTPMVVFHPGEIALSMGASAERGRTRRSSSARARQKPSGRSRPRTSCSISRTRRALHARRTSTAPRSRSVVRPMSGAAAQGSVRPGTISLS